MTSSAILQLTVSLCFTNGRIMNFAPFTFCDVHSGGRGDPGFPVGGGTNHPGRGRGRQHTSLPEFPKNCMKLRKFWSVEGAPPPLGSATVLYYSILLKITVSLCVKLAVSLLGFGIFPASCWSRSRYKI